MLFWRVICVASRMIARSKRVSKLVGDVKTQKGISEPEMRIAIAEVSIKQKLM